MNITIKNDQAKASWSSVTVEVPGSLTEAVELFGDEVTNVLFQFAMEKSNLDVRLRSLIKDETSAQTVVDNFFKGLVASAMTANDMTMRLIGLVGDSLITSDDVAKFVDAKKVSDKVVVYKALLVKADVVKDNIAIDLSDVEPDSIADIDVD